MAELTRLAIDTLQASITKWGYDRDIVFRTWYLIADTKSKEKINMAKALNKKINETESSEEYLQYLTKTIEEKWGPDSPYLRGDY